MVPERDVERALQLHVEHERDREPDREHDDRADQRRRERGVLADPARELERHARGARLDRLVLADAAQILGELECGPIPARAVLLHRGLEHDLHVERERVVQCSRVLRRLALDRLVERGLVVPLVERTLQRQRLVERDAERVDVGAPIERVGRTAELLRRHVRGRAEHLARLGDRADVRRLVAREPEVEDHGLAVGRDDQVARLDVAVDHARFMRGVDRARAALEEQERPMHVERRARRPARRDLALLRVVARGLGGAEFGGVRVLLAFGARFAEELRERLALDEAHRDPRRVAVDVRVVDRADRRVLEARDDLGFAAEATAAVLAHRLEARREHLERDLARDAHVFGEPHAPLAAAAELAHEAIRPEAPFVRVLRRARAGLLRARLAAQRQVLARDRLFVALEAREVVRERLRTAGVEVGEVLVEEVEDRCGFAIVARFHAGRS